MCGKPQLWQVLGVYKKPYCTGPKRDREKRFRMSIWGQGSHMVEGSSPLNHSFPFVPFSKMQNREIFKFLNFAPFLSQKLSYTNDVILRRKEIFWAIQRYLPHLARLFRSGDMPCSARWYWEKLRVAPPPRGVQDVVSGRVSALAPWRLTL